MTDKILLADDEMTFRETLARFLRDELLDVTTVDNGLDAIEAARTTAFGVVILDIQMPGADGIKALKENIQSTLREIYSAIDRHLVLRCNFPKRRSGMNATKGCIVEQ